MRATKRIVLHAGKGLGLFRVAARATRAGLRILCYHGTSLQTEHTFLPKLFMSPATFERRLRFLAEHRFPVLRLDDALERLDRGTLPPRATVITIDDGFYGTYQVAWPLLQRFGFPATIYVTSYYCVKGSPVFSLAIEYILWKARPSSIDLDGLGLPMVGRVSVADVAARQTLADQISEHGERHCSEDERVAIARALGARLGVDYDALAASRMLSLMTVSELHEMARAGADIQAHTHRHRFPPIEQEARREIEDNRKVLEPVAGRALAHFCYPSGEWFDEHWAWLRASGMQSATTCERGLNYQDTPKLALRRFLDSEDLTDLEFEADLYGYGEMLRRARSWLGSAEPARVWRKAAAPATSSDSHVGL